MAKLTFFRQARRDGGLRTGIDIDDDTVASQFDPGSDDADPAITWYVDVRFEGARLPGDVDTARQWLIRQTPAVQRELLAMAREIPSGVDPSDWPLLRQAKLPGGVSMIVACSAIRRIEAKQIASFIRDIAEHWKARVNELSSHVPT